MLRSALLPALAAVAWTLASPARAAAQPTPTVRPIPDAIALGPSTCLEKKAIADQVGMWLGRREIDARLEITVEDAANGVRFTVKRDGVTLGERTLGVKKVPCEEIHAALGLGVASAIDATLLTGLGVVPPPAEPPPTPPPPTDAAAPPPAAAQAPYVPTLMTDRGGIAFPPPAPLPPRPEAPNGPRKPPIFSAGVEGMVLIEVLPKVTLGFVPSAEMTIVRGFDLRLSGLVTGVTTIDIGGGTADTALLAGRFDACGVFYLKGDIGRLRGCVGLIAGGVDAAGSGFDDPRTVVSPWVAPSLRADVKWQIVKLFGLMFGVEGYFPGLKPEIQTVHGDGTLADAIAFPLAGVGLSFGPQLTF